MTDDEFPVLHWSRWVRFRIWLVRLYWRCRQLLCKHKDVEHWGYYDPYTGDADSGYQCNVCGKDLS